MTLRFVVTGTGRSGTGYAARLFEAAGVPCGHESLFTDKPAWGEVGPTRSGLIPRLKEPLGRGKESIRRRRSRLVGDASWMAVPRLGAFDGVSFLQLRHPLLVIRSFVGTRFFSQPDLHAAQWRYACSFFEPSGDDIVDAMEWWVRWNGMAMEHASLVYRLESLDEALFSRMLEMVGASSPRKRAQRALAATPGDVNSSATRGSQRGTMTWSDLPDGPTKTRLASAARRWGYRPEDPV